MAAKTVAINVTPITVFDPHGDQSTVFQKWQRWIRSFTLYADASGITDAKQKRQLLLHCAGQQTQDIFFTFDPEPADYEEAKKKLEEYFKPAKNLPYQRHIFRQAKQKDGETMAQFVTRLRQLAVDCEFGTDNDDFIRDQVIDKCNSQQLRTKLLAQKNLTLAMCLEIAAAKEASEQQATRISENESKIYAVQSRPRYPKKHEQRNQPLRNAYNSNQKLCTRCGQKNHLAKDCRCSREITCFKCNKQGHYASMCRSSTRTDKPKGRNALHSKNKVNQVANDETNEFSSSSEEYTYSINNIDKTVVSVNGLNVPMIIDSGATCNTINSRIAANLRDRGAMLKPCNKKIYPYHSSPVAITESIVLKVSVNHSKPITAEFLIINGDDTPLLGRQTAIELGLLKLCVNSTNDTNVLDQYPELCRGIGTLKDFEVTLHIDKDVPPVARKHSRIPFHLRDAVARELENLEKQQVIERVSGPTEWVSRIVAIPKPRKPEEIRVCIDMRDANKAILRTRHITPTIEELIADLNGATHFSKIDLKAGYHQLILHPDSRYITTFSTHCGLFRYKRLMFGLNSAAETFQHAIQTVIENIQGARNVSDDIIIFGKSSAEHDQALHKTLRRLQEAGLTVNPAKCEFGKAQIQFYGFTFSKDGLKPNPEKVKSLKEAKEPTNASEMRSFLGMAQYSARFIDKFSCITEPLRRLTHKNASWKWEEEEKNAFNSVRTALCENATLAYFDVTKPIELIVDASPVGIS